MIFWFRLAGGWSVNSGAKLQAIKLDLTQMTSCRKVIISIEQRDSAVFSFALVFLWGSIFFFFFSSSVNHPGVSEQHFGKAILFFTAFSQVFDRESILFPYFNGNVIDTWRGLLSIRDRGFRWETRDFPAVRTVNYSSFFSANISKYLQTSGINRCQVLAVKYAYSRLKFNLSANSQLLIKICQDIIVFVEIWFLDWPRVQPKKRS